MVEYNCSFHILSLNVDGKSQKMQFGIKPKEPAFCMILVHLHTAFGMDGWYWMVISKWAEAFGAKRTINSYTTEFIYMLQGDFFHWYPPKKLKFGKPRLGESSLT